MMLHNIIKCVRICFMVALLFANRESMVSGQQNPPKYVPPETRILFIFDASQSMAGTWQKETKIAIARNVLIHIIDSLEQLPNVKMAFAYTDIRVRFLRKIAMIPNLKCHLQKIMLR